MHKEDSISLQALKTFCRLSDMEDDEFCAKVFLAMIKQTPKHVMEMKSELTSASTFDHIKTRYKYLIDEGWKYACPMCTYPVGENENYKDVTDYTDYCPECGQKLIWDLE